MILEWNWLQVPEMVAELLAPRRGVLSPVAPTLAALVDPKHPHAWIDIDHVPHPAIVIEWTPTKDANGFPFWLAKCLYWADGEPQVATVPARNVRKA